MCCVRDDEHLILREKIRMQLKGCCFETIDEIKIESQPMLNLFISRL